MTSTRLLELDELRRFVRGELDRERRREVNRLLGRCLDPALPAVLYNLGLEWEQERADDKLPDSERQVSRFFTMLWERDRAFIDDVELIAAGTDAALAHATLFASGPRRPLEDRLVLVPQVQPGILDVHARPALARRRFVLFVTTDEPAFHQASNGSLDASQLPDAIGWQFDADDGGRITFWLATANRPELLDPLPSDAAAFAEWLPRIEAEPGCGLVAQRLSRRYLAEVGA